MKSRILLVEDDEFFAKVLKRQLERANFEVTHAIDGQAGWEKFQETIFDLCILDVVMPRKDGFTLAGEIRAMDFNIPIVFTSSRYMEQDRLQGFDIGADDYLVKPFNTDELISRIKVYIKRSRLLRSEKRIVYTVGNLIFDYSQLQLRHKDNEVDNHVRIAPKEAELLRYLCENSNKKLKREHILASVWGQDGYLAQRVMDVYLSRLRRHIAMDPSIRIETFHGKGLMLVINEMDRTHIIAKA
ncbi:response regulator transcription factor [Chitinophaga sp. HK235]|uniref:response regulator transcription factor n=1 Tax=Chitinophaga sp. HK235 TaxID=2952571 RepID=UPI001BAC254C|nr:response regulator transcription factor [Chitinophaga sp. HK235]